MVEGSNKWWKLKSEECFRSSWSGQQEELPDVWESAAEVVRKTAKKESGLSAGYMEAWDEIVQESI